LEHDYEARRADGTTENLSARIRNRFYLLMPAGIPPLIARDKVAAVYWTPPHGLPQQKLPVFLAECDRNIKTIDTFFPVLEVSAAVVEDQRQWFPHGPRAWQYVRDKFDRIEISGNLEDPIFALSCKHIGGHDYLPEEHAIGMSPDFYHFFLGLLVEGLLEDCVENGRYAIQIRAESEAGGGRGLCIDNGHEKPGFEGLARIEWRI